MTCNEKHTGWVLPKTPGPDQPRSTNRKQCSDYPAQSLVQGLLHVDDAIVLSFVFCSSCLVRGVCRLWPSDVGVSEEGRGPSLSFLHVDIQITTDSKPAPLHITPHNANPRAPRTAHDPDGVLTIHSTRRHCQSTGGHVVETCPLGGSCAVYFGHSVS